MSTQLILRQINSPLPFLVLSTDGSYSFSWTLGLISYQRYLLGYGYL